MAQGVSAQCDRMAGGARAEAEAIIAEARNKAVAQREHALASTQAEKAVLDERWRQKAEAEAIKAALAMQKLVVTSVLDRVEQIIEETVSGPHFPAILDALLAEVMAAAEGDVVVLAPEAHAGHVRAWLGANGYGHLPVEGSASMRDGVAVQDPSRTFRVSNTLSGRYARVEQETRRICMTGLFGNISAGMAG
jgi:vacuolar-type H+-ATPase subunit E/Vma4